MKTIRFERRDSESDAQWRARVLARLHAERDLPAAQRSHLKKLLREAKQARDHEKMLARLPA